MNTNEKLLEQADNERVARETEENAERRKVREREKPSVTKSKVAAPSDEPSHLSRYPKVKFTSDQLPIVAEVYRPFNYSDDVCRLESKSRKDLDKLDAQINEANDKFEELKAIPAKKMTSKDMSKLGETRDLLTDLNLKSLEMHENWLIAIYEKLLPEVKADYTIRCELEPKLFELIYQLLEGAGYLRPINGQPIRGSFNQACLIIHPLRRDWQDAVQNAQARISALESEAKSIKTQIENLGDQMEREKARRVAV